MAGVAYTSSLQQGDVCVAMIASTGGTGATLSGWTNIFLNQGGGQNSLSYKVQGATPDEASPGSWDTGTTSDSGASVVLAFSGVDTVTPLDVTSVSSTTNDPGAITPTSNDCAILVFGFDTALDTTPGSITNYSTPVAAQGNDTNDVSVAGCYRILTGGAGSSENPAAFSGWTFAGASQRTYTVALRPAAGQPYDLHEGGIKFVNPHMGGQNFQVWRKALNGLFVPPRKLVYG